jgi:hypothetical protein
MYSKEEERARDIMNGMNGRRMLLKILVDFLIGMYKHSSFILFYINNDAECSLAKREPVNDRPH